MNQRDVFKRERQLRQAGIIKPDTRAVYLHNTEETVRHAVLKLLVARHIQEAGRPWATEVELPGGGIVDVLDYGEPDGHAVVYEVETDPTPETVREKAERYTQSWIIRDVLVIDAGDAPETLSDAYEWVGRQVVG